MRWTTVRSVAVLAVGVYLLSPVWAADEDGYSPIFNGKDFTGLDFVLSSKQANPDKNADPTKTWSVQDNMIVCTGSPNGYFATKKSYKNYILRLDFQYPKNPGNSGYLIHITGEPKVWPKCIEVQGQYGGVCSIFPIGGAKGDRPKVDEAARKKAIKPANEWNSVEIRVQDGAIASYLNGVKICESEPYELKEGPIGFQSEGAPINFRNIRIKELN